MGIAESAYLLAKKAYKMIQQGVVSTNNYNALYNKPSINGIDLEGALSSEDLQIIDEDNVNVLINNKTKDLATIKYVDDSIKDVELAKFPNVTIIGSPIINGGQMRGFSANDYARFPFLVDLTEKPFEINFDILTGSNVANQQNIFDSDFGFAFAIRNSRFVIAMGSNGTSWNIGEAIGTNVVFPNTQYKIKISWDLSTYKVQLSTNGGKSYVTDISKDSTDSLYPTQIYIGVGENYAQVLNSFTGMIDFTKANLIVDSIISWVGLDVVGLETRLARDVSNIDAAGEEKIRQIAGGGGGGGHELTEEHLTGDIYNGKPVYERSFNGTIKAIGTLTEIPNTVISDLENVIDLYLIIKHTNGGFYPASFRSSSQYTRVVYNLTRGILYGEYDNTFLNMQLIATIKYTKTTD